MTFAQGRRRHLPEYVVVAFAALMAVLPLVVQGCSCGHDFGFHLQSWLEAGWQWRHGIVRPAWAFTPAWNAGEPRLLLYPPLSWVLGALLALGMPFTAVPAAFTWIALFLSGLTMRRLLRRWMGGWAATAGGCIYLANPYMLFAAYERTAYGELLAAAWMPLLLMALFEPRPRVWRVAVPVALLWLTNAPAAVVGCYTVLLIGLARLWQMRSAVTEALRYAGAVAAGVVLGLLVDGFYIVPVAVERHWVNINMAVIQEMRPSDNFLFHHTPDAAHDVVLAQASRIAVAMLVLALVSAAMLLLRRVRVEPLTGMRERAVELRHDASSAAAAGPLAVYSVAVLMLLLPVSAVVWRVAPELQFLQFPWRFLAAESAVAVALLMLVVRRIARERALPMAAAGLVLACAGGWFANHYYRQGCEAEDWPAARQLAFQHDAGFYPTDEYTPTDADNDELKQGLPAAWLTESVEGMPVPGDAFSVRVDAGHPEDRFYDATAAGPGYLVVRLRAFPEWHVLRDGTELHGLPERPDGLTAVPLDAGVHRVELHYLATPDQWQGAGLSVVGMAALVFFWRRRLDEPQATPVSSNGRNDC